MNRILLFLEQLYNSIRYNGFYIILSLVFPFIIWKFDAGAQIIVSMTENEFGLNIALSLMAFSALCFSTWCIPTLAIKIFQFFTGFSGSGNNKQKTDELRNCLFMQLINIYNGKESDKDGCNSTQKKNLKSQLPVRYFAVAPWILFTLTCLQVFYQNHGMIIGLVIIIGLIIVIDLAKGTVINLYETWFTKKHTTYSARIFLIRYAILSFIYLILIGVLFILTSFYSDTNFLKWLLIVSNGLFLCIFYSFLLYLENSHLDKYRTETETPSANLSYRISNINYWILLIYLIISIIVFYVFNQNQLIQYISPVVVIVTMATALIVFFELFFTSQLLLVFITRQKSCGKPDCILHTNAGQSKSSGDGLRLYRFVLIFLILVVINLYFFSSSNSHRIRKTAVAEKQYISAESRLALNDYFKKWFDSRNISEDDSVVYLISGQGGGSRAAAWCFMNMADLNNRYPDFFKKTFSVSTVSGSTTGANMFFASKFNNIALNDGNIKSAVSGLYGRNYMSSSFFGMMLGDFIEGKVDMFKEFPRDRNYHLQQEELAAFEETFEKKDNGFLENDYLWSYTDTNRHWPLFLINSTIVNFGTRGVFSPVKMNDFSIARDLYGEFKTNPADEGDNLPMVTCVNQSQAFPLLSAYNFIEGVGRLGDGGISENSGCASTWEVYQSLRKYCDSTMKHVRIICLNITNGSLQSNFKVSYENASIFNTVSAVANSPFAGNETYAYKNLERQIKYLKSRDTVINCSLDTSITLTRTLSKQAVDIMYQKMRSLNFTLPQ